MTEDTHSFWSLISEYTVEIPELQRDYAQGRKNNSAIEQIRNSLVEELVASVRNNKTMVLNFIYGETSEGRFIPVDGQQRLTTLFLFHWYVFSKCNYANGLEILKGFSYKTRDTSKRFCKQLCETQVDFEKDSIEEQINECYWMTGNFEHDSTIQAMLTMIETIHARMKDIEDISFALQLLISPECPICFLWLEMENFQKTNELYIKMNARGKLLSDFEIFKAKLQKSQLLTSEVVGGNNERDKILFISKFNNQYAELFYHLHGEEYDEAMMSFIKAIIRNAYLSFVSSHNVSQRDYRGEYSEIRQMNGSVFFKYIENGGRQFRGCNNSREAIIDGIKRICKLLDMFCSMEKPLVFDCHSAKEYYVEKDLFVRNYADENLEDDVARYSLFSYLYKFGIPANLDEKQAYIMWKRFTYNIVTNSLFQSRREDVCEAFVFIEKVIQSIDIPSEIGVLDAIASICAQNSTAAIRFQLEEEKVKAKLILTSAEWKKEIFDAEGYFNDGQIGFILDSCRKEEEYDINRFAVFSRKYRYIFSKDKKLDNGIEVNLFDKAMLCQQDGTDTYTAHLLKQSNSAASWGFPRRDYKDFLMNKTQIAKRAILTELVDSLEEDKNINDELRRIVSTVNHHEFLKPGNAWKGLFVDYDLFDVQMGAYKFKNCINLEKRNTEILMISGSTIRAYSMEIYTFLLYQEMLAMGMHAKLRPETTATICDHEGFPIRYIVYKDMKIGYSFEKDNKQKPYLVKESDTVHSYTKEELLNMLHDYV